ncbi:MAG TPA: aminomethyltransferase family protein, partial [Actinomycetota bacterium]|nr:aminomethyltransferase family protein [Actinomycetota bacterium]
VVRDATSSLACLGIWGPAAREILTVVTDDDLSNEAFPYMTAREIEVGDVPCLAARVTYVGELGWELYPPTEFATRLWDVLREAGEPDGLLPAGYRAIDSLRLEKGYRSWGADLTPDDSPLEAGLGFAVAFDKDADFMGRDAVQRLRDEGVTRELRCLTLVDPRSSTLGNEPVRAGEDIVARITSGGIGYSVGKSIAFASLPTGLDEDAELSIEVFGEWVDAEVVDDPLWDPRGERIRA